MIESDPEIILSEIFLENFQTLFEKNAGDKKTKINKFISKWYVPFLVKNIWYNYILWRWVDFLFFEQYFGEGGNGMCQILIGIGFWPRLRCRGGECNVWIGRCFIVSGERSCHGSMRSFFGLILFHTTAFRTVIKSIDLCIDCDALAVENASLGEYSCSL